MLRATSILLGRIWLVHATDSSIKLYDTHVAGRGIHILSSHEVPPYNLMLFRADPLPKQLNSRRLMRSTDQSTIREEALLATASRAV